MYSVKYRTRTEAGYLVARRRPYAMQFDDPDKRDGFVRIVRNTLANEDTFMLRLKAVRPTCTYRFENQEPEEKCEFTGKELIDGVTILSNKYMTGGYHHA